MSISSDGSVGVSGKFRVCHNKQAMAVKNESRKERVVESVLVQMVVIVV